MHRRRANAWIVSLAIAAICGCAQTREQGPARNTPAPVASSSELPKILSYLATTNTFSRQERENEFLTTAAAYRSNPSTSNQIRLAIVLHLPGPLPGDDARNQAILSELITKDPPMDEALHELAEAKLAESKRQSQLKSKNRALKRRVNKLNATIAEHQQRHKKELEELTAALGAAEAKIQALTSLEKAIKRNGNTEAAP